MISEQEHMITEQRQIIPEHKRSSTEQEHIIPEQNTHDPRTVTYYLKAEACHFRTETHYF